MWPSASRAHRFAVPARHRASGPRWPRHKTSATSAKPATRTSCASASATARHRRSTAAQCRLSGLGGTIRATTFAMSHATTRAPTGRAHRSATPGQRTSKTGARRRARPSQPSATPRSTRVAAPSHTPRVSKHRCISGPIFASTTHEPHALPTLRSDGVALHHQRHQRPQPRSGAAVLTTGTMTVATMARCRSKCRAACACPSA